MRQWVVAALLGTLVVTGCKRPVGPPPAPATPVPAAPATPPPAPETSSRDVAPVEDEYTRIKNMASDQIERLGLLQDVHFDYDSADLREGDRQVLAKNAEALKKFDFLRVTVEGHCDERGTVDYNIALGERRARAASEYLVSLGVPTDRLKTISYGKEVPVCQQSNEECWARNRRDHFAVTGKSK